MHNTGNDSLIDLMTESDSWDEIVVTNIFRGISIVVLFTVTTIVLLEDYWLWLWLGLGLTLIAILPMWDVLKLVKAKIHFSRLNHMMDGVSDDLSNKIKNPIIKIQDKLKI
ncbi:hypothetical protein JHD50_01855 [Sulfurimonas sp. MAG313]|nr:hypothetical protein [Sulfurimonas sp. MAG313]MDF1880054.1 hypothetical protein [Sulfurimonas sp. MAG313]